MNTQPSDPAAISRFGAELPGGAREPGPKPVATGSSGPADDPPRAPIRVAIACLVRRADRRLMVLVGRRPATTVLGGLWEFPGGKIERSESPEAALRRELREELGIEVPGPYRPLRTIDHAYPHGTVRLHAFVAELPDGVLPQLIAVEECRLVDLDELARMPTPEANREILVALRSLGLPPGRPDGRPDG